MVYRMGRLCIVEPIGRDTARLRPRAHTSRLSMSVCTTADCGNDPSNRSQAWLGLPHDPTKRRAIARGARLARMHGAGVQRPPKHGGVAAMRRSAQHGERPDGSSDAPFGCPVANRGGRAESGAGSGTTLRWCSARPWNARSAVRCGRRAPADPRPGAQCLSLALNTSLRIAPARRRGDVHGRLASSTRPAIARGRDTSTPFEALYTQWRTSESR